MPRRFAPFALSAVVVAVVFAWPGVSAYAAPEPALSSVPVSAPVPDAPTRFRDFLRDFRAEAIKAGIAAETYDRAVANINLNPRVETLNLIAKFVRPIWDYLNGAITNARVTRGKELLAQNSDLFARLQQTYGVPSEFLVAIWGMETGYGQNQGNFNLFEALATLAYEGPRVAYARRQLIAALKIAELEHRDPATMTGSWAGAFGLTQFVPTTFLERAVDGDGDGIRDLWNSPADALASTANYLKLAGWHSDVGWGEEVQLPAGFAFENADPEIRKSTSEWAAIGVRKINGEPLADSSEQSAIFLPAGARGPAFLLRDNFYAILKYNFATSYALAVSELADRYKGSDGIVASWPRDEVMLNESQRMVLQQCLTLLGFDTGGTDGIFGRLTRQALRGYQKARGIPADGFPTAQMLTRVLNERYSLP
jgi:membrane-bound lytic murein transglycosylase B